MSLQCEPACHWQLALCLFRSSKTQKQLKVNGRKDAETGLWVVRGHKCPAQNIGPHSYR